MQQLSYTIRSKSGWWQKYNKEKVRNRWKAEALNHSFDGERLTPLEVDYVLEELSGYHAMRDEATGIQVG
jgi:hypothetical protein